MSFIVSLALGLADQNCKCNRKVFVTPNKRRLNHHCRPVWLSNLESFICKKETRNRQVCELIRVRFLCGKRTRTTLKRRVKFLKSKNSSGRKTPVTSKRILVSHLWKNVRLQIYTGGHLEKSLLIHCTSQSDEVSVGIVSTHLCGRRLSEKSLTARV